VQLVLLAAGVATTLTVTPYFVEDDRFVTLQLVVTVPGAAKKEVVEVTWPLVTSSVFTAAVNEVVLCASMAPPHGGSGLPVTSLWFEPVTTKLVVVRSAAVGVFGVTNVTVNVAEALGASPAVPQTVVKRT